MIKQHRSVVEMMKQQHERNLMELKQLVKEGLEPVDQGRFILLKRGLIQGMYMAVSEFWYESSNTERERTRKSYNEVGKVTHRIQTDYDHLMARVFTGDIEQYYDWDNIKELRK